MVELDVILKDIGKITKVQWFQLLLLILPSILAALHMGAMVYLGAEQPHVCNMPYKDELTKNCGKNWTDEQTLKYIPWNEEKGQIESCSRYNFTRDDFDCTYWWPSMNESIKSESTPKSVETCTSWLYDNYIFRTTVVSDFDLVCSSRYKRRLSQAIFMLGVTLGCVFWGQISDRFGRKAGIIGPAITGVIFAILTAFVNSFTLFTAARFFVGFCVFPAFPTSFVMGTEIVPPKYRVWVGQSAQSVFAVGLCILALLGFFIRDWRTLQLVISVPLTVIVLYIWLMFESPRWLISSRRYIAAQNVIKRMLPKDTTAKSSEIEALENLAMRQQAKYSVGATTDANCNEEQKESDDKDIKKSTKIYSIIDLVRTPNMRKKSLVLFYNWMVVSCVYYGLTLNAADIGGDPFINLFLSGIVEVPSAYIAIILLEKCGRRPTLCSTLIFGGAACICMVFVPKDLLWLNISLSMAGKFSIAASFGTSYIYAAEIYPTPVRNLGLGTCSSWARIGGILSPFIAMLDAVAKPLPYLVFGIMSIIGGLATIILPEVLGIKLPETLEEGEQFGKGLGLCCGRETCEKDVENGEEGTKMLNNDKTLPVEANQQEKNRDNATMT